MSRAGATRTRDLRFVSRARHGIRAEIWASDRSVSGINQNGHNESKEIRENATETHVTTYLERHRAEEGGRMAQKTCPIQHPSCIAGCERNLGGRTPGGPGKNSVRDSKMKSTCVVTGIEHQEYLGGCRIRARERPHPLLRQGKRDCMSGKFYGQKSLREANTA